MSKIKIKPQGNRILIRRRKVTTSKGGIFLPESAQEKSKEGEVVAIGPGKVDEEGNLQPIDLKVGDLILFSSYAGTDVKTDDPDSEYLILSEDEVLGLLISKQ